MNTPDELPQAAPQIGYVEAMTELQAILDELESDQVDVDRLAGQVQRAAVLIRACRERIGAARVHVEQVVADLDGDQ